MTNEELVKSYLESETEDVLSQLIENNMGMIVKTAKKYKHNAYSIDDSIQDGICGLIKSIPLYNAKKGKFITYAYWLIRKAITEGRPEGRDSMGEAIRAIKSKNPDISMNDWFKEANKIYFRGVSKHNFMRHAVGHAKNMKLDHLGYDKTTNPNSDHVYEQNLQNNDSLDWQNKIDANIILDSLSSDARLLVTLRFMEDYSLDELAVMFNVSRATISNRINSILLKLQRKYNDNN